MTRPAVIIPFRCPAELLDEITRQIATSNHTRRGEPWTRTAFIVTALREKLAKMQRSRKRPQRRSRLGIVLDL